MFSFLRTLDYAMLFLLRACFVIVSNFRFFRLSVVPEGGNAAMETAEADSVMAEVSSNLSLLSCEIIMLTL